MDISNFINTLEPEIEHRIPSFQNLDSKLKSNTELSENSHLIQEELPFQEHPLDSSFQLLPEDPSSTAAKNKKSDKKAKKKKSDHSSNNSSQPHKNGSLPTPSLKRQLELGAYASIITAFRSQGELTWKKETVLQELRSILKISDERHRIEVKRAEESLSTNRSKSSGDVMEDGLSSPAESAGEWETSDDERKRKKQKVEKEPQFLTALPLPSSEAVLKLPKPKTKKREEDKSEKKSTRKKATKPHESSKIDFNMSSQDVINNLDLTPLAHNGGVPEELLEAKNSFDLDKIEEVVEREKQRKKEELETLKLQVAT